MTMRTLLVATFLAAATSAPAAAQDQAAPKRPAAWQVRADEADADTSKLFFVEMKPGWHITTGPSVILYDPARSATGNYRLEAEIFFFREKSDDGEGYGILLGGNQLDGPQQNYLYFLLRNDGKFLVKHRAGEEIHTIQDWTASPAIQRHTGTGGATVKNTITVDVGSQAVRFLVNGAEVASFPRDHMKAEGIVGLRVNHGLNVHVARLEVVR
jgi:hypothetical protein